MIHIVKYAPMLVTAFMPLISISTEPECITQATRYIAEIKDSEATDYPIADILAGEIVGALEWRPPFKELVVIACRDWRTLLDHFAELAPDRKSRTYLLHAMLYLPPDEYMKCLFRILELHKSGQIGKDEFQYIILMPPHVPKDENPEYFLSYNYQHPDVVKFLNDVQKHCNEQNDHSLDDYFSEILSGKKRRFLTINRAIDHITNAGGRDTSKLPVLPLADHNKNRH